MKTSESGDFAQVFLREKCIRVPHWQPGMSLEAGAAPFATAIFSKSAICSVREAIKSDRPILPLVADIAGLRHDGMNALFLEFPKGFN
jgi:hypothetical protein